MSSIDLSPALGDPYTRRDFATAALITIHLQRDTLDVAAGDPETTATSRVYEREERELAAIGRELRTASEVTDALAATGEGPPQHHTNARAQSHERRASGNSASCCRRDTSRV